MTRLLIIIYFCFVSLGASYGQTPKLEKSKEAIKATKVNCKQNPFTDPSFLRKLSEAYGKSFVDGLLKDTTFINSFGDSSTKFPLKKSGWTSDFEHIFSSEQISELDSLISSFEKETTNEIAIVTIESSWTTKENFDNYVLTIHNNWGVGKKNINNGIVIGISTGLKTIRISNGYGIESKLTDAATKVIMDSIIIPEFKQGNYFEGTKKGLLALMNKIR